MACCGNIVKGAVGLVVSVLDLDPAPEELKQKRLAICEACEWVIPCAHRKGPCVCSDCRCNLPRKCGILSEKCPLANPKW